MSSTVKVTAVSTNLENALLLLNSKKLYFTTLCQIFTDLNYLIPLNHYNGVGEEVRGYGASLITLGEVWSKIMEDRLQNFLGETTMIYETVTPHAPWS